MFRFLSLGALHRAANLCHIQAYIFFEYNPALWPSTWKSTSRIARSARAQNQFRRAVMHGRRVGSIRATGRQSFSRSAWQLWETRSCPCTATTPRNQRQQLLGTHQKRWKVEIAFRRSLEGLTRWKAPLPRCSVPPPHVRRDSGLR